ncbi:uncharacterized protein V2V93DRAFT_357156 [Kockiozyma suomiensis]|uniref:uncharacterized protein n=1 Tax=Kockiozyma suomiensis TaxID=1337062 RepID=UPI003343AFCB
MAIDIFHRLLDLWTEIVAIRESIELCERPHISSIATAVDRITWDLQALKQYTGVKNTVQALWSCILDSLRAIHAIICHLLMFKKDVHKLRCAYSLARNRIRFNRQKSTKIVIEHGTQYALNEWLKSHSKSPYPSPTEKSYLLKVSGLDRKQLDNWLAKARYKRNACLIRKR